MVYGIARSLSINTPMLAPIGAHACAFFSNPETTTHREKKTKKKVATGPVPSVYNLVARNSTFGNRRLSICLTSFSSAAFLVNKCSFFFFASSSSP